MRAKIERWLEKLEDNYPLIDNDSSSETYNQSIGIDLDRIVLRVGQNRKDELAVTQWKHIDDLEEFIDDAVDLMRDEIKGRFIAYKKGTAIGTVTIQGENKIDQQNGEVNTALTDCILRLVEENRRTMATINDNSTMLHETLQDLIQVEREHHLDSAQQAFDLEVASFQANANKQSTTDKALGLIAQTLQAKSMAVDVLEVARNLTEEQWSQIIQDEQVLEKFNSAFKN
jgi:hypothetical protein